MSGCAHRRSTEEEAFNELSFYSLAHAGPEFIHQNVVDAFTAQQADQTTKPIALTFALVGLYLSVEKNYSGRQVQLAHMKMASLRKAWPEFTIPAERGAITVFDVLNASPGKERDDRIRQWCESVWQAYRENHEKIVQLINAELYMVSGDGSTDRS